MAAVGVDMEEKKEEGEKEELRGGAEKAEHSLEGDFQFLPNELTNEPNPDEVTLEVFLAEKHHDMNR